MSKKYTVSEISRQTGDNSRQVQRKLKSLININKGSYIVDESIVNMLYPATTRDNHVAALSIEVEYDIVEGFTKDEYAEFQKRLIQYPILQKELEYHKESVRKHQRQMEVINDTLNKMASNAQDRNYIEASDKNILPKN